jgi:hypothetical protein
VSIRALALALLAASCSPAEVRTARTFVACLGAHDLPCLRRYHAPLVPRLNAWQRALSLDSFRVGPYARKAMQDADNPFWSVQPLSCASTLQKRELPSAAKSDAAGCRCGTVSARALAPAAAREQAFEPERARAARTHPALEVLANRNVAESRRVRTLWKVSCRCGARPVLVALLDLEGRDPPVRVFKVAGLCEAPDEAGFDASMRAAEKLLAGEIRPSLVPQR